jgi:copper homeostasis protein CutC
VDALSGGADRRAGGAPVLVEAYVETIEAARAAAEAGAGRLELCGPGEGGLTPSEALLDAVLGAVAIPVHVMVRPRAGDFAYSAEEFAAMERTVDALRTRAEGTANDAPDGGGASRRIGGVVFGILRADRTLDIERMAALAARARPLRVACHRAFDATPDADAALDQLLALGFDLVLTSGHAPTALEGAATLARHVQRAGEAARRTETSLAAGAARPTAMPSLTILAGGTVRAGNVRDLLARTGVREVHARATDPAAFAALVRAARSPAPPPG